MNDKIAIMNARLRSQLAGAEERTYSANHKRGPLNVSRDNYLILS